jgi:hypothetical protein
MFTQADVEKAKNELLQKSLGIIQEETAYAWGARAMAAYQLWQALSVSEFRSNSRDDHFLADALEYRHESLEHAALAGPQVYYAVHLVLQVLEPYL